MQIGAMNQNTGKFIFIGVGVALLCIAFVFIFRLNTRAASHSGTPHMASANPEAELAKINSTLRELAFDSAFEASGVRQLLDTTTVAWGEGTSANDKLLLQPLLAEAEAFLQARFGGSVQDYVAWRDGSGYVRQSREMLEKHVSLSGIWKGYFQADSVPNDDFATLFEKAVAGQESVHGEGTLAVAFANRVDACEVAIGRVTKAGTGRPRFEGFVGSIFAFGSNGSFPGWWKPPRSAKEIVAAQETVLTAHVGFLAAFASGERRAVSLRFVYDPKESHWFLDGVSQAAPQQGTPKFPRWEY